ncbi:class I tRNA ligase family protein [Candidatus Vidania fulgoroideorum]
MIKKTLNIYNSHFKNFKNFYLCEKNTKIKNRILCNKVFVIHDGPPYANGRVHLGHCINKIAKDFIMRTKIIFGYKSKFILGWDCHGIPIEKEVSKTYRFNIKKKCLEYSNRIVNEQKKVFDMLSLIDNKGYYKTTDKDIEAKEIKIFHFLLRKKMVKRKNILNYFCFNCNSVLSYHEIEKASCLGIKFSFYSFLIEKKSLSLSSIDKLLFLREFKNSSLSIGYFVNPIYRKIVKIDKEVYNNNINSNNIVDNNTITRLLRYEKVSFKLFHSLKKVCWRHNCFLIKKKSKQFILSINKNIKYNIIREINKVKFFPKNAKDGILNHILQRKYWTISRQRKWGVPMCLFVYKDNILKDKKLYSLIIDNIKKIGIVEWEKLKYSNYANNNIKNIKKIEDTLDVWFDSGLTHMTVLKNQRFDLKFPADIYVEGYDQYRGWFNSSIITSIIINKKLPFKNVFVHGFALDNFNKKLSKSLKNFTDPEIIIKEYGVDVLRFYISYRELTKDIKFSKLDLDSSRLLYVKIRNVFKFIINNTLDYKKTNISLLKPDYYYYIKSKIIINKIIFCLKNFEFVKVIKLIENFFLIDMNFYFNLIRERLYVFKKDSLSRQSAQTVLKHIGIKFSKIMFIFTPFLSYEVSMFLKKHVFLKTWKLHNLKKAYNKYVSLNKVLKLRNNIIKKIPRCFKNTLNKFEVVVFLKHKYNHLFSEINFLKNLFQLSDIRFVKSNINKFYIYRINKFKCIRCWRVYEYLKLDNLCDYCSYII